MKKVLKIVIPILIIIAIFVYGIYWAFYDMQRINGQDVIKTVMSPSQEYTITAYLNNGGATTSYAVLCTVTNNETEKERNIYWQYRCEEAEIIWLDDTTVNINGVELNILKDTYDYRRND